MNNEYYDYLEAGFKIFGLHGVDSKGNCECGNSECEALFKHPIASNWQHTPLWSDDQLETMEEMGQFSTGYGVLVSGYLVIDVDARNGGVKSFEKLCKDLEIDLDKECGFSVASGSGNGSRHLYFKYNGQESLKQHHDKYLGIDFKSSGYVVGDGSQHISGNTYETIKGFPQDVSEPPGLLINLLKKPNTYKAKTSLGVVDMSLNECKEILSFISPSCDYDTWVRIGMAIHQTFEGDGFEIWDDWSKQDDSYPNIETMEKKWHSFGKCQDPVQMGTLIHYAEENGYKQSIEFTSDIEFVETDKNTMVDLKRPPGLVGEICQWINDSAMYKRENLAVAAALTAVGNIGGLRCIDDRDGMTANMIAFCIAGSSTGKEHVQQRFSDMLRASGVIDAMHGAIKSEQEIVRNLTRHQAAYYSIDEIGIVLNKIINSKSASYLEGVIGLIMSAYSKADSYLPVGGDVKETLKSELKAEFAACDKMLNENENVEYNQRRLGQISRALENISSGIEAPFLSMIGYTTPVNFNGLFNFEMSTNGFLSRALMFDEPETNPKPCKPKIKKDIPLSIAARLTQIYQMGEFSMDAGQRVEYYGQKHPIPTDSAANQMLDDILMQFWEMAENAKDIGLEAIPRRGYELTAKISFILAIADGLRTVEHVEWAHAFVKSDIERKMRLATANIEKDENPADSIAVKIQDILANSDEGETQGVIVNRCRPQKKAVIIQVLDALVERKLIKIIEYQPKRNNKKTVKKYVAVG